ncbi:YbhB/YbcL family Raf kinase inhibitor-like protein [Demequina capsici]|uniref:YbhB/YbcL family Raf kinase inhibitor-like protein n=1 Tax=Demequina capsici TaxID=3075620 RepID=A0AA96F5Q7_9MICO|nr:MULTISPECIES: YbhB/YbcL family Raf kinase inhibitor-like protein [unclassified Demequina]WNM23648.1 YbhB/YbcL family Raf kinase inhibitor-like protein [Demequina sp. OYTSA14]WNM26487.1 YbhB/YbcL family Raf kinase inhibitor-like protein [Demequina sp. PMTSA13]
MQLKDLALTSPDIANGTRIDERFAGEVGSETPRMVVKGVPDDAVELAIICHDPDAPLPHGFTHWTLYGLPAIDGEIIPDVGRPGLNDDESFGYVGPFPPYGHGDHRYYFWVYALKRPVRGEPSRDEFLHRYADAVIEQARLVGIYSR